MSDSNVFLHNPKLFCAWLSKKLQEEFDSAAETVIQQSVKDYETRVRKVVGAAAVGLIEQVYSVERLGNDLRILVKVQE